MVQTPWASDAIGWARIRRGRRLSRQGQEPEAPIGEQLVVVAQELSDLYRSERAKAAELERAYDQLQHTYSAAIRTLAFVVEAKDNGTKQHLDRCQIYGLELAREIDPRLVDDPEVGVGFLLHDIGKVGVPESILTKAGPLSDDEWEIMRGHPLVGVRIVEPMQFLGEAVQVIKCHHERFDGTGYPQGMKGEQIPLAARIFAVVDSFDAMTSDRPYRPALTVEHAMEEIRRGRGTQFDPDIVVAFDELVQRTPWIAERRYSADLPATGNP